MSRVKILQIGAGMVGRVIAEELSGDFEVMALDGNPQNLDLLKARVPEIETIHCAVLGDDLLKAAIRRADMVSIALPGSSAPGPVRCALENGKPTCDISSISNELLTGEISGLASRCQTPYIPKIGIAPGMTNFLVGRGAAGLDRIDDVKIYVGGIPDTKIPPLDYKAVFCVEEVLQEYVDPAKTIRGGRRVTVEAMSDLHSVEFEGVGEFEAFVTDGLATLSETIPARNMAEYTVRWPGHVEKIRLLIDLGFFETGEKTFKGIRFSPREFLAEILGPLWRMDPAKNDRDLTLLKITLKGASGPDEAEYGWEMVDRYDERKGITSMGRCTGYTCATFLRALRDGLIVGKGLLAPELLARSDALYRFVMEELANKGIVFREMHSTTRVPGSNTLWL